MNKIVLGLLFVSALLLTGCSGNKPKEAGSFAYVPARPGAEVDTLTRWLIENRGKEVVSITAVVGENNMLQGYTLVFREGGNSSQRFAQLPKKSGWGSGNNSTVDELDAWHQRTRPSRMVSIAAIPGVDGGVAAYTICYEQ